MSDQHHTPTGTETVPALAEFSVVELEERFEFIDTCGSNGENCSQNTGCGGTSPTPTQPNPT